MTIYPINMCIETMGLTESKENIGGERQRETKREERS